MSFALADGAFPDSLGVLLPASNPHRIIAATNFGLMISENDGRTWRWVCEQAIAPYAALYQVGAPPDERLFSVSPNSGIVFSNDTACTWEPARGLLISASDVFADPTDSQHALAIAQENASASPAVMESFDGGKTFNRVLFAPTNVYITGVEVSRSDPQTIYTAMYNLSPDEAYLARTLDRGAHWKTITLPIRTVAPRILAINSNNPAVVYLRIIGTQRESLGRYDDAQESLQVLLDLDSPMTAFLHRSDGALIVGTKTTGAFISTDHGESFSSWTNAPHLRALGERNGLLYAVADNFMDGFAVAASEDQGTTWKPLLRYDEVEGPLECENIQLTCAIAWEEYKVTFNIQPPPVPTPPKTKSGCSVARSSYFTLTHTWLFIALLIVVRRRAYGRHHSPSRA